MKVNIGQEEVDLDPKVMEFNENTLNDFLMKDAGIYSYYHQKMVDAQYLVQKYEDLHDATYAKKFQENKESGATDKLAEAMAKCNPEVMEAKDKARVAKRIKDQLYGFLKSLDKAHDNALNLGYNIRKEMNILCKQDVKNLDEIMN